MEAYLDRLVRDNVSTANAISVQIWKTAPQALELDELKSVALMGLVESATRWEEFCERSNYDKNRTEYFRAYAIKRMRGAIFDHFRSTDWATRALRDKDKLLRQAGLEEGATEEQLIERTGLNKKQIRYTTTRMSNSPVPLEEAMSQEFEPTNGESSEDTITSRFLLETFADAVMALPEDQQSVLILKYFEGVDLRSIATRLGISVIKASQLHSDGVLTVHDVIVKYLDHEEA